MGGGQRTRVLLLSKSCNHNAFGSREKRVRLSDSGDWEKLQKAEGLTLKTKN